MTEEQIAKQCIKFLADTRNSQRRADQKDRMIKNQDFYRGHHWSETEYNVYKSVGIEPLIINRCRPITKAMCGLLLQNRQSLRVRPRKKGTESVAQVWTELIKHTEDLTQGDFAYIDLFRRGLIDTEAYIRLKIDKSRNVNGQPVFDVKTIYDVEVDMSNTSYDLDNGKFVIVSDWIDKDIIQKQYPDKIEEGKEYYGEDESPEASKLVDMLFDDNITYDEAVEVLEDKEIRQKYRYRIRSYYWREVVDAVLVTDKKENRTKLVTDPDKVAKAKKLRKSARYGVENNPIYKLHETKMIGNLFLEDTEWPFGQGESRFPVKRFSPMWDDGYASGLLDDIVSLNKEENIHRTLIIKVIKQLANSGWKVKKCLNDKAKKNLANFGSVEGVIIETELYGGEVEKIEPNQLPVGLFTHSQQIELDQKRVSGVDDATFGYETGKSESGRAISLKQQQNQVSAEMIFDNFYLTLERFGNYLLSVLQKLEIYTEEEIREVVSESSLLDQKMLEKANAILIRRLGVDLPSPMELPQPDPAAISFVKPEDQDFVYETMKQGVEGSQMYLKAYPQMKQGWDEIVELVAVDMLLEEMKKNTVGEYGVKVTVSPTAPTERLLRFMEMDAIASKYPGVIPPDMLIDATDLPDKDEIKARLMQQQSMQQMAMAGGVPQ